MVPDHIRKTAYVLFKRAVDKELNIGRDNRSFVYGSVYASCLINCIPKTALEVTRNSGVERKQMMKAYRMLKEELGFKTCTIDPADLIQRFGSRLNLKQQTITTAIKIANRVKGTKMTVGKQPQTVVASALYLASCMNRDKRTQREIANTVGIIEITFRKLTKQIVEEMEIGNLYNN